MASKVLSPHLTSKNEISDLICYVDTHSGLHYTLIFLMSPARLPGPLCPGGLFEKNLPKWSELPKFSPDLVSLDGHLSDTFLNAVLCVWKQKWIDCASMSEPTIVTMVEAMSNSLSEDIPPDSKPSYTKFTCRKYIVDYDMWAELVVSHRREKQRRGEDTCNLFNVVRATTRPRPPEAATRRLGLIRSRPYSAQTKWTN